MKDWEMDLVDLLPWQDVQSSTAIELESASFMAMQQTGG